VVRVTGKLVRFASGESRWRANRDPLSVHRWRARSTVPGPKRRIIDGCSVAAHRGWAAGPGNCKRRPFSDVRSTAKGIIYRVFGAGSRDVTPDLPTGPGIASAAAA